MQQLLIASSNQGKLQEIESLLEGEDIELVTPSQLGLSLEIVEDGETYAANAALKVLPYARASGLLTLADDSGLEVDCLGGAPGIHSARLAPAPGATDADRRAFLLEKLAASPRPWTARFYCTVALAGPEGEVSYAEGACEGEIIQQARGRHGFGYDPIFYIPQMGRTMAELTMPEKNRCSHRARAVRAALPEIRRRLSGLS
jgi:XTP/dITP diphosphohydrolase